MESIGGGDETEQRVGSLDKNFINFLMYCIFSTPAYEASGAFYKIEISLFIAEINSQRSHLWGRGVIAIVLHIPLECD